MVCKPNDTAQIAFSLNPLRINVTIPDTGGCVPFTTTLYGVSGLLSTDYYWHYGDNDTAHGDTVTHTYQHTGTFNVMVLAIDTNACNPVDSAFATIVVIDDSVHADFLLNVLNDCDSNLVVQLTNQSTNALQYLWTFGDGTSSTQQDENHSYHVPGTYTIELFATDTNRCHPYDSLSKTVRLKPNTYVDFTGQNVCFTDSTQFINLSSPTAQYN
jgi:PKD repeat protein